MIKYIALALSLTSSAVLANPTVFGMELGGMTESEFKKKYNSARHQGVSKYSQGNMYSIPVSEIHFDGLQKVTVIFDKEEKLSAVLTSLPKGKFTRLNDMLSNKYKLVNKNIPFVGDKSATYRNGNTEISLISPHLSFKMSMNYVTDQFNNIFDKITKQEAQKKHRNESSQL